MMPFQQKFLLAKKLVFQVLAALLVWSLLLAVAGDAERLLEEITVSAYRQLAPQATDSSITVPGTLTSREATVPNFEELVLLMSPTNSQGCIKEVFRAA